MISLFGKEEIKLFFCLNPLYELSPFLDHVLRRSDLLMLDSSVALATIHHIADAVLFWFAN